MDWSWPVGGGLVTLLVVLVKALYDAPRRQDLTDRDVAIARLEGELHALKEHPPDGHRTHGEGDSR